MRTAPTSTRRWKPSREERRRTLRAAIGLQYDLSDNFLLRAGVSTSNLPGVAGVINSSDNFSRTDWYLNGEWVF